ncbi:MAG TPA: protein kinase [Vicinamibacteria bacterium]|nr:protein kinase [Vicinamibacteria bacterium]
MTCPGCSAENDPASEACFTCGKALHALIQGAVLAGRYEILSPLGQGGMGRVYKAFDRVLEEHVALKVLRPEFAREPDMARRFLSEIKLARKVSHPNVCRIHEYGEDGGLRYISMEWIDGVDLKEYLRRRPLTVADAFELAIGAAGGLGAVHERGIIHCDFKTSNIMVDQRGRVRLLDFGIARVAGADTGTFTAAGHVMGTPEYMSPEQALGARLDFRSDIYALGCVVFEIFSGQAVFQGETPLVTLFKHINEDPPLDGAWVPLPAPLVPPLRIALAKDPAARYETIALFIAALKDARGRCLLDAPSAAPCERPGPAPAPETATILAAPPAPSETAPYAPLPPIHSARRRAVGAAVALLTVAVAAAVLGTRETPVRSRPQPPTAPRLDSAAAPATTTPSVAAPAGTPPARPRPEPTARPGPSTSPALVASARVPDLGRLAVGTLRLTVVPPAEVTVDGRLVGTVSAHEMSLPPGTHVVRILHPDYKPLQRIVTIDPGVTLDLALDLAEKAIRLPR